MSKLTAKDGSTAATDQSTLKTAGFSGFDEEIRITISWISKLREALEPALGTLRIYEAHDVTFGRWLEFHPAEPYAEKKGGQQPEAAE